MSAIAMNEFSIWLGWFCQAITWFPIVWLVIALLIGIPWIIRDEIKLKRTAPKPAEVAAHADHVEALHGADGLGMVGDAMTEALQRGDFQTRRFLKEVSQELARRRFSNHSDTQHEIL
jgi:hypothetical protein